MLQGISVLTGFVVRDLVFNAGIKEKNMNKAKNLYKIVAKMFPQNLKKVEVNANKKCVNRFVINVIFI